MDSQMHMVAVVLAFLSCAGFIWAHFERCWKISSDELAVQPYVTCYGLWKICTATDGFGEFTCDGYFGKTILEFATPTRVHFARATIISGTILTGIGMFLAGAGGVCCRVQSLERNTKNSYRCCAGWMFIVSGIAVMAATTWYAAIIYKERQWYWDTGTFGLQHKFGRGIYLAWGSSILALLAGFALSCCSSDGCGLLCGFKNERNYISDKYYNQPVDFKSPPEYV